MEKLAAYILNFKNEHGECSQFILADLLDYLLKEFKNKKEEKVKIMIPNNLLELHEGICGGKNLHKSMDVSSIEDIYKNIQNCSITFECARETKRYIERQLEYVGEIDIVLTK